jgi:predicted amidohydrolase
MRDLRIHLAQTSPALGDLRRNLEQHLDALRSARKAKAGLVVFPELSLTGYFLNDLTDDVALASDDPMLRRLIAASKGIAAVFGYVERSRDHRLYNAAAFVENGRLLHVHRKVYLPTYGIFAESRYIAPGDRFVAFDASFGRIGILTCEDAWHLATSYLLFLQDVDLLVCPSASPGRGLTEKGQVSSLRAWESILEALAGLYQVYVAYCNRVGVEDGMTFFGGSRVVDPFGTVIALLEGLGPGLAAAALEDASLRRARLFAPLRRDERPHLVLRELRRILCAR